MGRFDEPALNGGELTMSRSSSSPSHHVHLELEALEDRCVLSTAAYVSTLYVDLLHRVPQASEVAPWVTAINNGMSPAAVATAFTDSPEYLNERRPGLVPAVSEPPCHAFGSRPLGRRAPDRPAGDAAASLPPGFRRVLRRQRRQLRPWISALYQKALGRAAAPSEAAAWEQALQSGLSRQAVALNIVTSPEADARLVEAAYQAILGHAPDPAGLAVWVSQLEHGMTPSQLIAALVSSSELIAQEGGLDTVVQPVHRPVHVDTFGEPFLPPFFGGPVFGFTSGGFSGGGFSGGGFSGGGFSGGGFSGGGFSGGGSGS